MKITSGYLVFYNAAQAVGWSLVLARISKSAFMKTTTAEAYAVAGQDVCILQLVSFLEVLHAAFGLVRSGVTTAFMQWAGRSHVLFAVLNNVPEVQTSPAVFGMFAAWALSEVIRYPQYALTTLDMCPTWLTWLRYTAFIVLYPIGVFYGEMYLIYSALPSIKKHNLYGDYFKLLPFDYHTFLLVLMVVYPLLWLQLYLHMFKQRRSKVGKQRTGKQSSKRSKRE